MIELLRPAEQNLPDFGHPFTPLQVLRALPNITDWRKYKAQSDKIWLGVYKMKNTFSNGCLGSHIDEERSEMRYVMRIAKSVSHQNFERILHFLRGVCLLECLFIPTKSYQTDKKCRPPHQMMWVKM